jgi:hypothetical protein
LATAVCRRRGSKGKRKANVGLVPLLLGLPHVALERIERLVLELLDVSSGICKSRAKEKKRISYAVDDSKDETKASLGEERTPTPPDRSHTRPVHFHLTSSNIPRSLSVNARLRASPTLASLRGRNRTLRCGTRPAPARAALLSTVLLLLMILLRCLRRRLCSLSE